MQFGFDIYANLLSATVTKCTETQLSQSVNTNNRLTGHSYDASGNTTNDGSFSYTWDAESRMKSGAGVNYTYDGDGRRAKKSSGKLYWYGIGADPLAESDLSGNVSEEYIFFGGKRIARRVVSPSSVSYYFADHLGTSRVIVQANATTACYEADFTPYGKERVITNTCPQNYKFTGKERDSESTLDYFGARYYSWTVGRFHSPDLPFIDQHLGNPQSWNLYAYVRNNPMKFVDPTGNYLQPYGASPNDMLPNVTGWDFIGGGQTWAMQMALSATPEPNAGGVINQTISVFQIDNERLMLQRTVSIEHRNPDGTLTNIYSVTNVFFSTVAGQEGKFLNAFTITRSSTVGLGQKPPSPIGQKTALNSFQAGKAVGFRVFNEAQQAAMPGMATSFGRELKKDVQAHPAKYAIHALELGFAPVHLTNVTWNAVKVSGEVSLAIYSAYKAYQEVKKINRGEQ